MGYPHEICGEGIFAYVVLKESSKFEETIITNELKAMVKKQIASYAVPHLFLVNLTTNFYTILCFVINLFEVYFKSA